MKKFTKKEVKLLIFVLLIALIALFLNYFYFPMKEDIENLSNELIETNSELSVLVTKYNEIPELQEKIKTEGDTFAKISKDFMEVWDDPQYLYFTEKSLGKNTKVSSFSNQGVTSVDEYFTGIFSLNFTTEYEELVSLLEDLEKAEYYNNILTMNISTNTVNDKIQNLQVNLVIKFFALENSQEYPENYDFMQGRFSKKNLFK